MTIKKITPVGEKIIPMHDGNGDLPKEGKNLVLNSYWYRLEADKDVSFDDPDPDLPGGEEHHAEQ
ncbi:hypothetical protein [Herbaspirillum huttiense]|uniref:hypothetical protein n=1 Tax=Herbaspirillum huttiense TaxID=863372 RepID=UPI003F31764C